MFSNKISSLFSVDNNAMVDLKFIVLVKAINNERIDFGSFSGKLQYPDFLGIQLDSFRKFFQLNSTPGGRKDEGSRNC